MKSVSHLNSILLLLLALCLTFSQGLRAQEAPPAPPGPEIPASAAEPVPPAPDSIEEPAGDQAVDPTEDGPVVEAVDEAGEDQEMVKPAEEEEEQNQSRHHRRRGNNERVSFGSNATLEAGDRAEAVISIFGSSTSAGDVSDAVVSILGSSRVTGGTVGDAVVSVMGNTYVNGHVRGEVVAVLGNVELGPEAVVEGEVVCIGGQVTRAATASVRGNVQNIAVAGQNFDFTGLTTWFTECLLYGRPLAFNRHLIWAWTIALGALGLYALIALIAPAGVVKCAETLEQRPGYALLAALLTLLLTPVAYILLALLITVVIGLVLIPAFSLGLFFASIFGKIVMLAWLGRRFTKLLGDGPLSHPVFGVLIGGVIVLGLYTIPFVGFITYKLLGILGLGVVVYTLILQFKASRPPRPVAAAPVQPPVPGTGVMVAGASPVGAMAGDGVPPVGPGVPAAPTVISAATLPRAGFWLRLGAAVLDLIMIAIVMGMLEGFFRMFNFHPSGAFPFWIVLYCVIMWATKGTTVGGVICGLKLVRMDDRPVDWGVAIVRGLSAFLSLAVAGLGFIWVAFDEDKQSWHDKIAGTTIVKVPKGTSLL